MTRGQWIERVERLVINPLETDDDIDVLIIEGICQALDEAKTLGCYEDLLAASRARCGHVEILREALQTLDARGWAAKALTQEQLAETIAQRDDRVGRS